MAPSAATKRIVVLISGRGSNLEAILDSELRDQVVGVASNRPGVRGLDLARERGVPTLVVPHAGFPSREAFDEALARAIDAWSPDLVVLAGFMRVLTPAFVRRYAGRLINIHPSLLPAFPGLDTHRRALEEGVKVHGCTVHFVTDDLDHGPIIAQEAVPVLQADDEAALAARVLGAEHRILPQAIRWFCAGRLRVDGNRVHLADA